MKKKKIALLQSVVAVALAAAIFVGSTFAYFTDSVSSNPNIIQGGNLDIGLQWTADLANGPWIDTETQANQPIFNYDKWEPGYTEVRYFKIENRGKLAFKYILDIVPSGTTSDLADVIDVYYIQNPTANIASRADLSAMKSAGTLADVISGTVTATGVLLPDGAAAAYPDGEMVIGVALKMQESAGNQYQNKSIGSTFSVLLRATQYNWEEDSYGADYDTDAEYPQIDLPINLCYSIEGLVDTDGLLTEDVEMTGANGIKVTVKAGTKIVDGATSLVLSIDEKAESESNLTAEANEELTAFDVHVEGIAEDNTVPLVVAMGEVLPTGLNEGNLALYHVENSETKAMKREATVADLDEHNEFVYDPATGALTVAMATFSEVAMLSDTTKAWEGNYDYSWYTNAVAVADSESTTEYTIANADQLAAFGAIVGGMNGQTQDSFSGKTVKLLADINLGDDEENNDADKIFYPIGYYYTDDNNADGTTGDYYSTVNSFNGTFDGNGHTISNFYQNTWEIKGDYDGNYYKDAMGLFGYVNGGTVKNLTVDSFSSDGEYTPTGVIAAYADGDAAFENIAITNCNPRVYNTGNGGIIGVAGSTGTDDDSDITLKNITVDNSNKISALWGSWDVACGGLVGMYRGNVDGSGNATGDTISFENCHVSAQIDVYNDVCANYQYYAYRYAGMIIGSVRHNTTTVIDGVTKTIPNMTGISAEDCTVNYGDWNDYYYCEFEENTIASYSEDYQFSRVDKSEIVFDENGNVTGCTHTHTDEEDKRAVYLPFHQLFTGYSWGVNSIGIEELEGIENITVTIGQEESVTKFETKFTGDFLYRVGNQNTVSIGSLFAAKEDVTISSSGVVVSIDPVGENMNVSGTFTANTTDWTQGTIQFSGTGVVKVTIQDYNFCTPTELILEVVDAVNATTATSATANNVVLLNDISSGFTVSGCYTVYGNGFTLNYTGNGQYLNNGLRQGVVTVSENGTLDNLRITASIYPAAYLYYGSNSFGEAVQDGPSSVEGDKTRYHYQLSSVVAKGNATISNCYIYGGRTNIFVDTGDVTIKDTILECGTVANAQIQSTSEYTVTFENVTTISYQVNPTIGDTSLTMLGAGVLVGPDTETNPTIVLNGDFKQYNWVNAEDQSAVSNTMSKAIIQGALDATDYNHTIKSETASNLGIIYMNTADATVTNNTGLPYELGDVTITVSANSVSGKVYSLQNATEEQIYFDVENADKTTTQGDYLPTFSFDLGDQEISYDGSDDTRYLYGDTNGITALYQDGEDPITLELTKLATIYKYTGNNYSVTGACKDSNGNILTANNGVVTLEAQGDYTLEFTVYDNIFYDKDGNKVEKSVERTFTVPLTLTVKAADIKNAEVTIEKTALDGGYTTVNFTDYKLQINFLEVISVTDYDNTGTGTTVDLSSNISSATLTPDSVNVFTTASTITITYTDGRVLTVNLSKISGSSPGTKTATVNTSSGVYFITDGALDNKPTETSSQNTCTITSVSFKGNSGSSVTNDTDVTVTWELGSSSSSGGCVTPDTLVTLANGTQKEIQYVTYEDDLLVWDFFKGEYTAMPSAIIFDHGYDNNTVIELNFSDGTTVKAVNLHQFLDADLNKFVTIDGESVAQYVGHNFAKQNGDSYKTVKLVDYKVTQEYVEAYGIISAGHYNILVEGMFSTDFMPQDYDLFNYFEIGDDMKFDVEKMREDIETYGLYNYKDFEDYLTREQFEAFNVKYFKVSVGKGKYTYQGIINLIDEYLG